MKTETQQPESHRLLHKMLETMAKALCPFWEWYAEGYDIYGDHEEMTLWARRAAATALASEYVDILGPATLRPSMYAGDRAWRSERDWKADAVTAFLSPDTTQKFMGMDVVVNPAMPEGKIALVNCIRCMDKGLVHLGPNMDLCPAIGCTARDQWKHSGRGWTRKSAPNHTGNT